MPAFQNTDVQGPPIWLKAALGDGLSPSTPYVPSVALVDGSGNQITSFGGGTQYTEGDVDSTITGTAILWEDSGNTLRAVSATKPLPVNPGIYNGIPTENSVPVLTSSTQILAANANRTFLFIQNQDATNPIFVATDGNAAVADGTCTKIVAGGNRTWENGFIPNGAVFGIATGGTVTTHVEEAS